uniref:Calcium binding EGF domain protein n=1 Tax=Eptatretus burgeri TaxID=7764 RepID=A0A8C4N3X0_EPTBU
MSTQRLSVKNIDASYDAAENVLRYASTSTISSATVENPCDDGSHDCDSDAHCLPLRGQGYACKCGVGSTGSERVCYENLPVDSCHTSTPGCDSTERARCISTGPTTLRCKCLPGFTGSGRVCLDINECWSNPCDRNAVCDNNAGSFSCHCESGFVGDGFKCLPAPDIPALLIGTSSQILRLPLDRFSFKPGTRPAVIADVRSILLSRKGSILCDIYEDHRSWKKERSS